MNIGQLVRIGGRTRLSPTFSLVGLTGIVIPSAPGAPPNCVTVWVNWQDSGYENLDELPPAVNVPPEHLEPITAQDAEDAKLAANPAPKLKSVGLSAAPDAAASTRKAAPKPQLAAAPPLAEVPQAAKETQAPQASHLAEALPKAKDSQEEIVPPAADDDEARPKLRLI